MCVPYKGAFHASGRNCNPKLDSANLACPLDPLALNQVDMRMPHDGDGGRDTEKKWYRGMANMTGVRLENSNGTV